MRRFVKSYISGLFSLALLLTLSAAVNADNLPRKEQLTDIDLQWMQVKKREVSDLASRHFGRFFNTDKAHNLRLIQDLLDSKIIARTDTELLQGMGFIIGDLLAKEEGLRWIVYVDSRGRSRALEVPNKPDVVFLGTSIARRYEVGAPVNVQQVYQKLQSAAQYIRSRFYVREMQ